MGLKRNIVGVAAAGAMIMFAAGCGSSSTPSATTTAASTSAASSAAASTAAASTSAASTAAATSVTVPITVVNNTGVELTTFCASPSGQSSWGSNLLTSTLANGESGTGNFTFTADTLVWDFQMGDSEGTTIDFYNVDFTNASTSGATLTLTFDSSTGTDTLTPSWS